MIRNPRFLILIMTFVVPLLAAQHTPDPVLTVRDLAAKFLTLYRTATRENSTGDRRFSLWKQMYGFAAVPPTPEGDLMARRILDTAWPRYSEAINKVENGRVALGSQPTDFEKQLTEVGEAKDKGLIRPIFILPPILNNGEKTNTYLSGEGRMIKEAMSVTNFVSRASMADLCLKLGEKVALGEKVEQWIGITNA